MSRLWRRTFGLRDLSVFPINEEPEFPPSENDSTRAMDAGRARASDIAMDVEGDRSSEIADLRKELSKIAKAQFRARAVTESALEAIQHTVEAIRTSLKSSARKERKGEDPTSDGWIEELLSVADGLEEAIRSAEATHSGLDAAWTDGIRIVHRRVCNMLEKENVHPVPAVGEVFDPRLHIAVEVEPTSDAAENVITQEHRKGYRLGDRVLRYAEVVVAKKEENPRKT